MGARRGGAGAAGAELHRAVTMRALSPRDLLDVWDNGVHQDGVERALGILRAGCPELSYDASLRLTVGERDARLFQLHCLTFDHVLDGYAECPLCTTPVEFALDITALDVAPDHQQREGVVRSAGIEIEFRLPDSRDLRIVAEASDVEAGRRELVSRCVTLASRDGAPVATTGLPADVIVEMARSMSSAQPAADVVLDLGCPACGHRWQTLLDITAFIWAEVAAAAKRLLRAVHTLAHAYGWREEEVLQLDERRRADYIALVTA